MRARIDSILRARGINEAFPVEEITTRSFKDSQTVLNVMGGIEYHVLPHLALRGSLTLERSSTLGTLKPLEDPLSDLSLKHKNSKI